MGTAGRPRVTWPWLALAVASTVGQCVVLYLPDPAPVTAGLDFPGLDKIVHLTIFAVPTWALLRVVQRRWIVPAAMLVQAVGSEFVQGALLSHRSGDVLDTVADTVGITSGLALAYWTRRRPG